jgi:C1A family cysteine protease
MNLILSPAGRRYGRLPNKPDHRDFGILSLVTPLFLSVQRILPATYSLEQFLGPVKDQGDEGACTAFAGTGNLEFLYRKYLNSAQIFSPAFLYYQARLLDGDPNDDGGSTGRSVSMAMQHFGVCLESQDPYIAGQYAIAPTPAQTTEALMYKSGAYHFLTTVSDICACIASGYCAMVGFTVYESFESIGADGMMPIPNKNKEQVLGGHEVLCYGYDNTNKLLAFHNSWGSSWGKSGSFYMPYSVAADQDILMDAVIQHLGKPW